MRWLAVMLAVCSIPASALAALTPAQEQRLAELDAGISDLSNQERALDLQITDEQQKLVRLRHDVPSEDEVKGLRATLNQYAESLKPLNRRVELTQIDVNEAQNQDRKARLQLALDAALKERQKMQDWIDGQIKGPGADPGGGYPPVRLAGGLAAFRVHVKQAETARDEKQHVVAEAERRLQGDIDTLKALGQKRRVLEAEREVLVLARTARPPSATTRPAPPPRPRLSWEVVNIQPRRSGDNITYRFFIRFNEHNGMPVLMTQTKRTREPAPLQDEFKWPHYLAVVDRQMDAASRTVGPEALTVSRANNYQGQFRTTFKGKDKAGNPVECEVVWSAKDAPREPEFGEMTVYTPKEGVIGDGWWGMEVRVQIPAQQTVDRDLRQMTVSVLGLGDFTLTAFVEKDRPTLFEGFLPFPIGPFTMTFRLPPEMGIKEKTIRCTREAPRAPGANLLQHWLKRLAEDQQACDDLRTKGVLSGGVRTGGYFTAPRPTSPDAGARYKPATAEDHALAAARLGETYTELARLYLGSGDYVRAASHAKTAEGLLKPTAKEPFRDMSAVEVQSHTALALHDRGGLDRAITRMAQVYEGWARRIRPERRSTKPDPSNLAGAAQCYERLAETSLLLGAGDAEALKLYDLGARFKAEAKAQNYPVTDASGCPNLTAVLRKRTATRE